ncbi:hypothetical protein [Streptomyces spectabilis]|uniref:Secreted protein n=1 Tax=Streptomyces spectabilis TaxID=68270 RepID=A0A5P2XH00_STRST|nr:hypothetical protein [Streptomyces spectabilis]MBB5109485.1 hypothetical protein [Streptomyces spectabilis]MCI3904644.1 hypothetical protein [Streptomyces spectabilis]QEV61722.1 hypothetical protein CP982_25915 [Streptomyces spectabilis]GGV54625.1 hypothetical protein GCM10010245_86410 [Streptomyces spectabilis]
MNRNLRARLAASAGVVALLAGGMLVAAPAAQATGPECATFLSDPLGRSTTDGNVFCGVGAAKIPVLSEVVCPVGLRYVSQVSAGSSTMACERAAK